VFINEFSLSSTAIGDDAQLIFGSKYLTTHERGKLIMEVSKKNIIVHETYDPVNVVDDLALIKLHIPLPLKKGGICYWGMLVIKILYVNIS